MGSSLITPLLAVQESGYVLNVWAGSSLLSRYIPLESIRESISGNQEVGTFEFDAVDTAVSIGAISGERYVRVEDAGGTRFKGFIRSWSPKVMGASRYWSVTAFGIESLLDSIVVLQNTRYAGESDKTRLQYLLATYGSQGLYNDAFGSTDTSKIQTLNASMPKQKFKYQTLRQAIESVLGAASDTSNYYIDHAGRLHTFDATHPEADTAPYVIRVGTPGGGEVAPEELTLERDSTELRNDYYVRAKYRAYDTRVISQNSMDLYGRRTAVVDAPDADTLAKATAVGRAALRDTAYPKVRGSFYVSTPYDTGWKVGQWITFYSSVHNLSGDQSRVIGLICEYQAGTGWRRQEVRFGNDRLRLRTGGTVQQSTTSSVG